MSGLAQLRAIASGELPEPPIIRLLGFSILEIEEGKVVFGVTPAEYHYLHDFPARRQITTVHDLDPNLGNRLYADGRLFAWYRAGYPALYHDSAGSRRGRVCKGALIWHSARRQAWPWSVSAG